MPGKPTSRKREAAKSQGVPERQGVREDNGVVIILGNRIDIKELVGKSRSTSSRLNKRQSSYQLPYMFLGSVWILRALSNRLILTQEKRRF